VKYIFLHCTKIGYFITGKGFNWHGEDIRNLARQIVSKISPDESIAPFDSIDINWTDIGEALGLEGELCQRKWSALCNSVSY
jgi:hypothetical protein